MRPLNDPLVGRTFAQYEILARVGGGAMGVVYRARDTKLGRQVALKFLPQQWSHDEAAKQRFVREAQAASATHHPNICTIHDIETADDGQLFIVMAFYEGPTLKQRLESGPMRLDEALEIATQIADGLAKAHAQGVVHRDIKPGNVILTEDGVRLLDFGLATFVDALKLTAENTPFGTPAYMSPEQVRGHAADARSDVWAVGVVLYEMLAGHVPFQGSHAEAIAHAIRSEAPEPLHARRPEIGEEVEQLVFRALHKEPSVRYQSGRALARALRQIRGLSVPLDLRTEPIPSPVESAPRRRARGWWRAAAAAAVIVIVGGGAYVATVPNEPSRLVVAPFGNQTGDSRLEEYRLALTQTLTLALRDSNEVAVVPYARVLEPLGRFVRPGADVSNRDAVTAISANTRVALVLVPTLLRDGGAWRARVELRDRATATNVWTYETAPETTALSADAAYRLAIRLADAVDDHFRGRTAKVRHALMRMVGAANSRGGHMQSLEAAKAFEEGSRAYEDLEYASARRAFAVAVQRDPRSPLALAWLGRAALLTRENDEAIEAAEQAIARVSDETPRSIELFARAVWAEARRDFEAAEESYRALMDAAPDDPTWALELGGFLDRRDRNADAVVAYHRALAVDPGLVRARLELCRLYSPSRLNESVEARKQGESALATYRMLAADADGPRPSGGEGQALMCLADTLRTGTSADRVQARRHAEAAREIFDALGFSYSRARAEYYVAFLAAVTGDYAAAVPLGERALQTAMTAGNAAIRPLIMNNLGVVHVALGNRPIAADYYRQASMLYQSWHEEARAAQILANRGAMLIESGNPEEGILDVRNALVVAEKLGDKSFQAFCLRVVATYCRNQGRHREAQTELNKGLAIASERNLTEAVTLMTTHVALSQFETGDYGKSRLSLVQALKDGTGRLSTEAQIRLARTDVRLGDLKSAQEGLAKARQDLEKSPSRPLRSLLLLVQGEVASESGRPRDARLAFEDASSVWNGTAPDAAAVEGRARLGLIVAQEGRVESGAQMIRDSLAAARQLAHLGLEARCRILLAQVELLRRRFDEAATAMNGIPADDEVRTIGAELRAEAHDVWSRIRAGRGDAAGARVETAATQARLDEIARSLSEPYRQTFLARSSVRRLAQ